MGLLMVSLISKNLSWVERIGLSFPVGIGMQTMLMALINLCRLRLTVVSVLSVGLLLMLVLAAVLYRRYLQARRHPHPLQGWNTAGYNLVWLFFMGLIVYFEYMNFVKCMYYPTFDRDSLAGFDTIGYVIAQEKTFRHLSLFQQDYVPYIHSAGSYITYAPMVQLSYAFVYLLGTGTSKLIPALMFLFFLIAFYGVIKRVAGHTCAAVATFLMMITPDMIAFSSLSATNVIHMVSASLGVIYVALWTRSRSHEELLLGTLLLGLNVWTRTDGVVFIGAVLPVVGFISIREKQWKSLFLSCCAFVPVLFWMLFCKVSGFYAEGIVITHLFWDADKFGTICRGIKSLFIGHFYGISFLFFVFSLLCNSWFLIKKRDNLLLPAMIILALLLYMLMLYQIDYKWDSIHNVLAYSVKRFLFCFVPLVWFYSMSNQWIVSAFNRLETALK